MTTTDRIDSLRERHANLDHKLGEEATRPLPDEATLLELKRQKLAIKDEIVRLERV